MSDRVLTWPKDKAAISALAGSKSFATVDPGADGMAMAWKASPELWNRYKALMRPVVMERIRNYKGAVRFAHRCAEAGVSVMVIERAFVGRSNPGSGIKLSRTGGYVQGAFSYATAGFDPAVVEIASQTWQSSALGKAKSKKREDRKVEAVRQGAIWMAGDDRWSAAGKEQKSAIADALGMARWWVNLHYPDTEIFDGL